MNVEKEADSSNRDAAGKKSRTYFLIAYAFLVAMALFWSVDSSIVYIFLGLACFFLFLAFYARPKTVVKSDSSSYRSQYQRDYPRSTESVEDKLKQMFQRKSSSEVRTCAVYALGKLRTAEARMLIEDVQNDKELPVRHAATSILREWPA